jgi:two-component system sensor histidine kinase DesK
VIVSVIGVILLPFNMYNRTKQEALEDQLEDANKKLSQLVIIEERQRIAQDLHDTLGQKLSLMGLKSDLAGELLNVDAEAVKNELEDINQTARTALKEIREMVSDMRGNKLSDEIVWIKQILVAANIECALEGSPELKGTPLLVGVSPTFREKHMLS